MIELLKQYEIDFYFGSIVVFCSIWIEEIYKMIKKR